MIFSEPGYTNYDLHFRLFGLPVRVHPMFWLVALILGSNSSDVRELLLWIVAVFVSILVHELGHSLVMRWYRIRSSIVLYSFGGLAVPYAGDASRYQSTRTLGQVLISFAGAGAGFLLVLVLLGGLYALGYGKGIAYDPLGNWLPGVRLLPHYYAESTIKKYFELKIYDPSMVEMLLNKLFWISVFWGLVNLLPVYPLDGGNISRELSQAVSPRGGVRFSLQLSVAVASIIAAVSMWFWIKNYVSVDVAVPLRYLLLNPYLYIAVLFGYLAYQSYLILQSYQSHRGW